MKSFSLLLFLVVMYSVDLCAKNINYTITTSYEYNNLVLKANSSNETFAGDTIFIEKDLNLSDVGTIASFDGVIIGNGHVISNLTAPLFDKVGPKGVVLGVVFDESCSIKDGLDAGFVSKECNGTVRDCMNYGRVNISSDSHVYAGAFVGKLSSGKIVNCVNYGAIAAAYSGSQTYYVARAGGMCGRAMNSQVIACSNFGDISTSTYAQANCGGLVGDSQESAVVGCENNGKISSTLFCSTTSGQTSQIVHYTGGIVGLSQGGVINKCNNYAEVTTNAQYASGVVGCAQNATLSNLGNHGAVNALSSSYFVCASGICGEHYASDLSEGKNFVNCINTGALKASTGNSICTVAGICKEIMNANVANLLNVGTLSSSASALGTSFKIENFESEGSNLINEITTIDEANSYILNENTGLEMLLWVETVNGLRLDECFCYDVSVQQGVAEVRCYPMENALYTISLYKDVNLVETSKDVVESTFCNLLPETEYTIKVFDSARADIVVNDSFRTLPIMFELTIDSIGYTSVQCKLVCDAFGISCREKGIKYAITDSMEWDYLRLDVESDMVILDSLYDKNRYILIPYFTSVSGNTYEGPATYVETKEIIPLLEYDAQKTTSSSFEFHTANSELVSDYEYGITYLDEMRGRVYVPSQNGTVKIIKLNYNTIYELDSYIKKNGEVCIYSLGTFTTLLNETLKPIQISESAAMVAVVADNGEAYPYMDIKTIEYRALDSPESVAASTITPYLVDGKNLYMATLLLDTPGKYQYRLKSTNEYSETNSRYAESFTEWVVFDTEGNNCEVVVPYFYNIRLDSIANGVDVSCVVVQGEESVEKYGIEYKVVENKEPLLLDITRDVKTGRLSVIFNSLVPDLEYHGRFYAKVGDGRKYYSKEFFFNSSGIVSVLPDNDLFVSETVVNPYTRFCLPVCLKNKAEITAFQFDLFLPDGFAFAKDDDGNDLIELLETRTNKRDHSIMSMKQADGSTRVLCYSNSNKAFAGESGVVMNLFIDVADSVELGSYTVEMKNIILTEVGGETKYEVLKNSGIVNVGTFELIPGDVNCDGCIDIADVSGIVAIILGDNSNGLNVGVADVNKDYCIDVADISGIVSTIQRKDVGLNSSLKRAHSVSSALNDTDDCALFVEQFEISAGEEKEVKVMMGNSCDSFTSLQFDLKMPKGLEIVNEDGCYLIELGSRTNDRRHVMPEAVLQEDGYLRVLTYSNRNELFKDESGDVLVMRIRASEELSCSSYIIAVENIVLGRVDGSKSTPADNSTTVSVNVTGIDSVVTDVCRETGVCYDLVGRVVDKPKKGIYIRNGKKILVK